jgi:hypothetical protein
VVQLFGVAGVWTIVLIVVIAIPVILVLFYLRRPYDRKSVPRDSLSVKGKAELRRPSLELPSQAIDELIRDEAADLSHAKTGDRPVE